MITTKLKVNQSATARSDKPKISLLALIILMVIGILLPLLSIEAIAYVFPGLIPPEVKSVFQDNQEQPLKGLTPDKILGYKYAPGLLNFPVPFEDDEAANTYPVSTVSLGYSDAGFRDDGLTGEVFAAVVGDSYASCASVAMDACWVELLEQETGRDLANLGVVGYSPQQESRMLSQYGLPLQPKLVLWVFFPNDLNDAWRFDQFGSGAAQEGQFWQNPAKAWLAQNSVVYNLGAFFWYNRALFYNLATVDKASMPPDSNLVWWLTYTDPNVPEVAAGLHLTQEAILEARQQTLAQNDETEFVVIIFPYREQVYAPATLQPQLDQLNQVLANFCQKENLACIDLTAALRDKASQKKELIYFHKDIHLNTQGNKITAEILAEVLKAHWR